MNQLSQPASRLLLAAALIAWAAAPALGQSNWPQWRGPQGDGQSAVKLPVRWNDANVRWKAALPGAGQSSPVVWDRRVLLTAAEDEGRRRLVLCLDSGDGRLLWSKTVWTGQAEPTHQMNMHASASCATDGERVVAFFGKGGLHALTLQGEPLWSRQLGEFAGPWGTAASPLIIGDLVVQNCDAEDQAFLLAVDKRTGKDVWRTSRERLRGWSTPLLVDAGGRSELVLNGETGVRAYDLQSGKELWFCKGDTGRGTPTVTPAGDLLVVVNGRPGAMFAVRPGGQGQVNATHEVWRTMRRGGRDLPSPIVVGEHLLVVNLRPGVATCYLAASGKELGKQRLKGEFSASPVAAAGVAYFPNEDGEVFVLEPADDGVKIVARNRIQPMFDNEVFRSCVTPLADGSLLLRSSRAIYCIGS